MNNDSKVGTGRKIKGKPKNLGKECTIEKKCKRVKDPNRSIEKRDEGLTGRGSRYFPEPCCYLVWWNGYYYCYWHPIYCGYY